MPTIKKKNARKTLKKRKSNTVVVISSEIDEKDTLFPEKVAHAREILSKAKFLDPRFGPTRKA
ncbi:MAG TPA: hypothetical protein VFE32_00395 [Puia sp.]|jgi:hypothetical protein|nr:hypothetical protein [Puia sp.]